MNLWMPRWHALQAYLLLQKPQRVFLKYYQDAPASDLFAEWLSLQAVAMSRQPVLIPLLFQNGKFSI